MRQVFSREQTALALIWDPSRVRKERDLPSPHSESWEHNRNPTLLLKLSGTFLLRYAHRALFRLLFHEPPRLGSVPYRDRLRGCDRSHPAAQQSPNLNEHPGGVFILTG